VISQNQAVTNHFVTVANLKEVPMGRRGRTSLQDETTFFVTTTIVNHALVFTEDKYSDILIRNIKHYQAEYNFLILGYIIMPSHFRWIVEIDPGKGAISDIMRDIKKYSARDLMDQIKNEGKENLLQIFECMALRNEKRKLWTKRFDDQVIRNTEMLNIKLDYIHYNPVKVGLVENPEDYKYSSARNYLLNDHSVIFVDTNRY
jgi:REP-associated tyrosine transposase